MTQEFHISVTPIRENEYLVRTERVAPGVPLAEEQVIWPVAEWLHRASLLMHDPLQGVLRGHPCQTLALDTGAVATATAVQTTRSSDLVVFGQQLYNSLFQGTIRDSWVMAQGIAQHRQEVLRLRLGLKDHRLPRLPWEVLHAGDRPIATRTDVVFSRYHSSFAAISSSSQFRQLPVVEAGQPLKILMVLAAPTDQEVLALKQEALQLQEELQGALQNGNRHGSLSEIHLTILEQPGREQLAQALEHNHYQVLHYAGHSNLGDAGGKLYLVNSRTGLTETLNGDDLAGLLVNNGIRMAVFNSCRGVYTATSDAAGGAGEGNLAEALVKRGIPAVLAMAERIPDDVACNLSRLFYRNLKQFYPIDLSLNRARQGLLSSCGSNQLYWALPILYLQPEFNGYLVSAEDGTEAMAGILRTTQGAIAEKPFVNELVADLPSFRGGQSLAEGLLDAVDPGLEAFDDPDALDDFLDPEELEDNLYDDPEAGAGDTVAQLVQRLSENPRHDRDEAPLPASPAEDLMPPDEPGVALDYLTVSGSVNPTALATPSGGNRGDLAAIAAMAEVAPANMTDVDDGSVYLELERLLAETGKLTAAITTCNQAIRENPANPEAYDCLGQALSQQGYLVEAIAAYEQAIRVQPNLAQAHNHLGQALYQQGKFKEAIRAFSRAVQLAPDSVEARQNLEIALHRQGVHLPPEQSVVPAGGAPFPATLPRHRRLASFSEDGGGTIATASSQGRQSQRSHVSWMKALCWLGAGTLVTSALTLGIWLYQKQGIPLLSQPDPAQSVPPTIENFNELKQANNNVVTAYATKQLNNGNIAAARGAIEILLDRQALAQATAALTPVLTKEAENPTINFLMGRLAWQEVAQGSQDFDAQDARRYWESASKRQPDALYLNALGFAYYREGELDRARDAWFKALRLAELSPVTTVAQQSGGTPSPEELTAYAGMALVLMKKAETQPPTKRAMTQMKAIELRERVLLGDPIRFQPDALAKNWMWSEQAIKDWQKLLALQ